MWKVKTKECICDNNGNGIWWKGEKVDRRRFLSFFFSSPGFDVNLISRLLRRKWVVWFYQSCCCCLYRIIEYSLVAFSILICIFQYFQFFSLLASIHFTPVDIVGALQIWMHKNISHFRPIPGTLSCISQNPPITTIKTLIFLDESPLLFRKNKTHTHTHIQTTLSNNESCLLLYVSIRWIQFPSIVFLLLRIRVWYINDLTHAIYIAFFGGTMVRRY